MAINDLPSPSDPAAPPGGQRHLRSYREAASHLVRNDQRALPRHHPVESRPSSKPLPRSPAQRTHQEPSPPPVSPSSPRPRSAVVSPPPSPPSTPPSSSSSRCRSRTPSPPHASPSTREPSSSSSGGNKALRSVSPGGTPAPSAGAALRQQGQASPQGQALFPRRVRWADALIASVRTRPRTPRADVSSLFYSRSDERRFRREAEADRYSEDEWCEGMDEEVEPSPQEPELKAPESPPQPPASPHQPLWSPRRERKDYAISKAVVVFDGAAKTYGSDLPPLLAMGGSCAVEAALESSSEFSFDDAAFWNGQLTWS